jgi:predicted nucleic acid-binding protein
MRGWRAAFLAVVLAAGAARADDTAEVEAPLKATDDLTRGASSVAVVEMQVTRWIVLPGVARNPHLPGYPMLTAVLDTSTLQALWRGGALDTLRAYAEAALIPGAVADETRAWWSPERAALAPDLDALPWLERVDVSPDDCRATAARLLGPADGARWVEEDGGARLVAIRGDRRLRAFARVDLELLTVAVERRGCLIVDANKARAAARALGVPAWTTLDLIDALSAAGLVADRRATLEAIRATGYRPNLRLDAGPR